MMRKKKEAETEKVKEKDVATGVVHEVDLTGEEFQKLRKEKSWT